MTIQSSYVTNNIELTRARARIIIMASSLFQTLRKLQIIECKNRAATRYNGSHGECYNPTTAMNNGRKGDLIVRMQNTITAEICWLAHICMYVHVWNLQKVFL